MNDALIKMAYKLVLAEQQRAKEKARHDSKDAVEREHYKSTITANFIWNPIRDAIELEDLQKFAQLIIQECLRQIRKDENGSASDAIGRIAGYFDIE